jgi:hypothetical protein
MVSSGNMTLSGWGSNIEMPAWVEVNQENAQELLGFYRYLNHTELQSGIDILQRISGKKDSPKLFLQYPSKIEELYLSECSSHGCRVISKSILHIGAKMRLILFGLKSKYIVILHWVTLVTTFPCPQRNLRFHHSSPCHKG